MVTCICHFNNEPDLSIIDLLFLLKIFTSPIQLQERTGDDNFELIVADFNSSDDNLKTIADITERGFTIRVLKMAGSYNKATGIAAATNLVKVCVWHNTGCVEFDVVQAERIYVPCKY